MKEKNNRLKIGQLAERSGVSPSTIKHYVNEGLLPKPVKTSPNMAYYDESMVDKIRIIKRLQREKFLPLDVIRLLIDSGEALDEELELSRAVLKSSGGGPAPVSVKESRIEKKTGVPLETIRLLEKKGLVQPVTREGTRFYDESDLKIIEIIGFRTEMGIPVDYSIRMMEIYREAIGSAAREDIRLFARSFMGDIPTRQAIKFMTEVDDTMDTFILLIKNRIFRSMGEGAIRELGRIPEELRLLNILPVKGNFLPKNSPREPVPATLYHILRGEYGAALELEGNDDPDEMSHERRALNLLTRILAEGRSGSTGTVTERIEEYLSDARNRPLYSALAILSHFYAVARAPGLSEPIFHSKKILHLIGNMRSSEEENFLIRIVTDYINGAAHCILPGVIDTRDDGIAILRNLNAEITGSLQLDRELPPWLKKTVRYELIPAIRLRVNRLLALVLLSQGEREEALGHLGTIVREGDPESELSRWARMAMLENE